MSNVIAGVVRGQYPHLEEHIAQKKAIYERYREAFKDLPVQMNPITEGTVQTGPGRLQRRVYQRKGQDLPHRDPGNPGKL